MATRVQITCINKNDRFNPYERIRRVGGSGWSISLDEAIAEVEAGRYEFYVMAGGRTVDVIVAQRGSTKYLKTKPDHETPDNLLSLAECR